MHSHRLLFSKDGPARYISHLDLMRTFPRAFLRAEIPLLHTEGFHPHASISIALPLSIGFSSVCELLDFTPAGEIDLAKLPELLNRALPEGICAISCLPNVSPLKDLQFVRYEVKLLYDSGVPEGAVDGIRSLLARDSLPVPKKGKPSKGNPTGAAETDIRPMIREVSVQRGGDGLILLDVAVCARDPGLNPSLLVAAIGKYRPALTPDFASFRRLALYDKEMRTFL